MSGTTGLVHKKGQHTFKVENTFKVKDCYFLDLMCEMSLISGLNMFHFRVQVFF